jgi:hypothetical protein
MPLTLEGIPAVSQRLQALRTAPLAGLRMGLGEEARRILQESTRLCPVLTGDLVRSGELEGPTVEGPQVVTSVRYGGHGAVPYAAVQEFDVTLNHPRGGQAHFLQQPLFEATAGLLTRLAATLRPTLGGSR